MPKLSWRTVSRRCQQSIWPAYSARLRHSTRPILVGPFRSEVGFEALYWLPFLDHLVASGVARDRLIPISRGGAAVWYDTPTGLELYSLRSPKDVRIENRLQQQATGLLKQTRETAFDQGVLHDAAETFGLTRYHVLHPKWMYQTLAPFWEGTQGLAWLDQRTKWRVLTPPPLPGALTLPETFAAVRFYLRPTLPGSALAKQAAVACVKQLASSVPVIILSSDAHLDDHVDLGLGRIPNVTYLRDLIPLTVETNLAVQSAVLARAVTFVGTYGGFAQLALRFGRSVVSFYDQWGGTSMAHKHLADAMSLRTGIPFQVYSLHELGLAQRVLPAVVHTALPVAHASCVSA